MRRIPSLVSAACDRGSWASLERERNFRGFRGTKLLLILFSSSPSPLVFAARLVYRNLGELDIRGQREREKRSVRARRRASGWKINTSPRFCTRRDDIVLRRAHPRRGQSRGCVSSTLVFRSDFHTDSEFLPRPNEDRGLATSRGP